MADSMNQKKVENVNNNSASSNSNNDNSSSQGFSDGTKFLFVLVVAASFLASAYFFFTYFRFYPSAQQATGTVLSVHKTYVRKTGYHWRIWVGFDIPGQKNLRILLDDYQSNSNAYILNDSISFYYDPKNPNEARIDPPTGVFMYGVIYLILGLYGLYAVRNLNK